MLTSTLRNVGGSVMMAIPKAMLEGLGLAANAKVRLSIDHGRLVVETRPKPRYTLAELLAGCDPSVPQDAEERSWDGAEPIGRETWQVDRGDIWHVDLNPIKGREQANPRYVMILTARAFNRIGIPLVVPITTGGEFGRMHGFTVSLSGAGTNATGMILCHQVRALDLRACAGRFAESAPEFIVDDVLAKVGALLE